MMQVKLATVTLLGLAAVSAVVQAPSLDPSAMAQSVGAQSAGTPIAREPGYEPGLPVSNKASNIVASDSRSAIAPALPVPPVGDNADPRDYLRAAHAALV